MRFTGPLAADGLDRAYAAADLLVHPSYAETYGMVVTEALARGLPVVAADVGGLPEALAAGPATSPPGLLLPPEEPLALAGALRGWLSDPVLRERWRVAARTRRAILPDWSQTTARIAHLLAAVAG